jgi:peptidoglycan hydrolase FlgJ
MTSEISNRAAVYGDFAGLQKLKTSARGNDPNALRQVAQQFESLFARMMIKSMRKAIGSDPIFGSDQAQMYQGMFDDQLSLELTRGRGLGLAAMLMRQLQGAGQSAGDSSRTSKSTSPAPAAVAGPSPTASTTDVARGQFVRELWPQAQQAAHRLGVHPVSLIAQAALESNWGRTVPRSGNGDSSHNLFGIKATHAWRGGSVTTATREFQDGDAVPVQASFRAYADPAAGFQDYVALLGRDPRYRDALNRGSDVGAFARALQKGGYATDPDYASKVTAVAQQVSALLSTQTAPKGALKFADSRPITVGTAAL